ncbi:MAG: hypothetical protein IJE43_07370 [Alphaproteobacteria bacterium]|nr:hypothetical protein [Alphaproteobacteria bacterium]
MKKLVLGLGLILSISACGTNLAPIYYNNTDKAKALFYCTKDDFKKSKSCITPEIYNTTKQIDEQGNINIVYKDSLYFQKYVHLAISRSNDNTTFIAIMFYMRNYDWMFYNRAYDRDGNELLLMPVKRKVVDQRYVSNAIETLEQFAIVVSKEYLEKYKERELEIKLYGENGSEVFTIQPAIVNAFLYNIDKFEKDNINVR